MVLELWQQHLQAKAESREPDIDYGRVGDLLAHAAVADAFDDCLNDRHGTGHDITALSGEFLLSVIMQGGPAICAAQYLLGKTAERQGRFDDATLFYEMALEADPSYAPPCTPLAWLAFDRSQFSQARQLLTRSGLEPRSTEFRFLPKRVGGRTRPARNACCPCGSGRKYKTCHADTSLLSPWDRLQLKYDRYSATKSRHVRVVMLAFLACDFDEDRADRYLGDAFLTDVSRFEGNGLADFAEVRGSLFPADERHVLDQLLATRRMLYQITQVDGGLRLQALDETGTPGGDEVQVTGNLEQVDLRPGDHVLARLLQTNSSSAELIGEWLRVPADVEPSLRERLDIRSSPPSAHDDDVHDMAQSLASWYVNQYGSALTGQAVHR